MFSDFFLKYLADPGLLNSSPGDRAQRRKLRLADGNLESAANKYPVVNGIPRFEAGEYAKSFGAQWARWPKLQFESENQARPMEGHTRKMWEAITRFDSQPPVEPGENRVVVDMGCGSGRFVEIARSKGYKVIAIDYSSAVEQTAAAFHDDSDVLVCQASALQMPIADNSVDGVYSIGVLHHTPDPEAGIREAYRILKPGGWCGVNVYYRGGFYDLPMVTVLRKLFNAVKPAVGYTPALWYSYLTGAVLRSASLVCPPLYPLIFRQAIPYIHTKDWRWSVLDTFDSVTPAYQSTHTTREVWEWFRDAGFQSIQPTSWSSASFWAVK